MDNLIDTKNITIKQLIEYWSNAENTHTDYDLFYRHKLGIRTKNCRFFEMNLDDLYVLADYKYKKLIGFNTKEELEEYISIDDLLFNVDKFSDKELNQIMLDLKEKSMLLREP